MTTETQTSIRAKAYSIWEAEGCPDGKNLDHWLRAEAEITNEKAKPNKPRRKPQGKKTGG